MIDFSTFFPTLGSNISVTLRGPKDLKAVLCSPREDTSTLWTARKKNKLVFLEIGPQSRRLFGNFENAVRTAGQSSLKNRAPGQKLCWRLANDMPFLRCEYHLPSLLFNRLFNGLKMTQNRPYFGYSDGGPFDRALPANQEELSETAWWVNYTWIVDQDRLCQTPRFWPPCLHVSSEAASLLAAMAIKK